MTDVRLVVFDLDGTLVDSSADLANAVNAMIDDLGASRLPDPAIVAMVGEGAAMLVRRALSAAGLDADLPDALDRFLAHYNAHLLDRTRPYPGMLEMLPTLAGRIPLAVLTNKPADATERLLEGLGMRGYFRDVIGGDTSFGRKPAAAGLTHLVEASSVSTGQALLVGDSPIDLATARNAGTRICLARYGFGYRFKPADFRGDEWFIDTASELLGLLGL